MGYYAKISNKNINAKTLEKNRGTEQPSRMTDQVNHYKEARETTKALTI